MNFISNVSKLYLISFNDIQNRDNENGICIALVLTCTDGYDDRWGEGGRGDAFL